MAVTNQHVTIKGNKDGLIFLLNDQCEFDELLAELRHKLETTHQQILTGPIVHVHVKLGNRAVTDGQREEIRKLIRSRGNLLVQSIVSDAPEPPETARPRLRIQKGIVRSGQTLSFDGTLLFIGDVNPGGALICTGDIHVMGSLRGMAHAGSGGNVMSVITAAHLRPTQLRIADVVSRPPDEWGLDSDATMEFAYLDQGRMEIDKIVHLHRIRPGVLDFKGE